MLNTTYPQNSLQNQFKFLDPNCVHFICSDAMRIEEIIHNGHFDPSESRKFIGKTITEIDFFQLSKKANAELTLHKINNFNVYSSKTIDNVSRITTTETQTLIDAIQKLPVGIVFVDSNHQIVSANKIFSTIIGVRSSQIINENLIELLSRSSSTEFSQLHSGKFQFEVQNKISLNNYIIEIEFHPYKATLLDKNVDGYYIIHDKTENRSIKKSLSEIYEKYHYTSRFVNEALFDLNIITKEIVWGEGVNKLFGYKTNFCPSWETWATLIHPDDYINSRLGFLSALRQKEKSIWSHNFRIKKSNGEYAHIASSAYIIREQNNKPTRVIGSLRDVSEKKNYRRDRAKLINTALVNEREKLSMELHDSIGQYLIAINLYLNEIDCDKEDSNYQKTRSLVQDTIKITHDLCYEINPPKLRDGLMDGIQLMVDELDQTSSMKIEFEHENINQEKFDLIDIFQNFRIIQEFINNSIKHSKAKNLRIKAYTHHQSIFIDIWDNGVGFDLNNEENFRLGVKNMIYRAELANTMLCLNSSSKGTFMKLKLNDIILV